MSPCCLTVVAGYIVHMGATRMQATHGLRFIVQSDKHPEHCEARIEAFLLLVQETLAGMTTDEFQTHISALSGQLVRGTSLLHNA